MTTTAHSAANTNAAPEKLDAGRTDSHLQKAARRRPGGFHIACSSLRLCRNDKIIEK